MSERDRKCYDITPSMAEKHWKYNQRDNGNQGIYLTLVVYVTAHGLIIFCLSTWQIPRPRKILGKTNSKQPVSSQA